MWLRVGSYLVGSVARYTPIFKPSSGIGCTGHIFAPKEDLSTMNEESACVVSEKAGGKSNASIVINRTICSWACAKDDVKTDDEGSKVTEGATGTAYDCIGHAETAAGFGKRCKRVDTRCDTGTLVDVVVLIVNDR